MKCLNVTCLYCNTFLSELFAGSFSYGDITCHNCNVKYQVIDESNIIFSFEINFIIDNKSYYVKYFPGILSSPRLFMYEANDICNIIGEEATEYILRPLPQIKEQLFKLINFI